MATTVHEKRTAVRGLGEIALRVNNLATMQKFYGEVIGLPLMTQELEALGDYSNKDKKQRSERLRGPEHVHLWIDTFKSAAER